MKKILLIAILATIPSFALADFGETSGYLYYNFTYAGQVITNNWYLVNNGNQTIQVNISAPRNFKACINYCGTTNSFLSPDESFILSFDQYGIINISAFNQSYLIKVSVRVLSPIHQMYLIGALQLSNGTGAHIAIGTEKRVYVNYGNVTYSPHGTTPTTTIPESISTQHKQQSSGLAVVNSSNQTQIGTKTASVIPIVALVAATIFGVLTIVAYLKYRKSK